MLDPDVITANSEIKLSYSFSFWRLYNGNPEGMPIPFIFQSIEITVNK